MAPQLLYLDANGALTLAVTTLSVYYDPATGQLSAAAPPSGGGGGTPAVISIGMEGQSLTFAALVGLAAGSENELLALGNLVAAVATGTENEALTRSGVGSETTSAGAENEALATQTVGTEPATAAGGEGESMAVSSTVAAIGYVTTAATAGGTVWTNPTNVEADDGSTAGWTVSDSLGGGAATTSTGTLTATSPKLGVTPSGWTRSKVETIVRRSDSAVGLGATGDTATFTVDLQDKTGATLVSHVVNDSFTAAGSNANAVVAVDVTSAVAGISDADLALTKFLLTASFARTLVATGTRSWTVAVDSVGLRVTYTRSGIS